MNRRIDKTFINKKVAEWCKGGLVTLTERLALEHGLEIGIDYGRSTPNIKSAQWLLEEAQKIILEWEHSRFNDQNETFHDGMQKLFSLLVDKVYKIKETARED